MALSNDISSASDHYRVVGSIANNLEAFMLEHYGVELEPLANAVGLPIEDLQSRDCRVSLDRMCRLFDALSGITGDESLGLRYAEVFEFGGTGFFGYGLKNAPTLRDVFSFYAKYLPVVSDLAYIGLEIDHRYHRLQWAMPPLIFHRGQYLACVCALLVRLVRENFDPHWAPLEVRLEFRAPKDLRPFRGAICPRLIFDEPMGSMMVSSASLDARNALADARLFEMICQQFDKAMLGKRTALSLIDRVMNEISNSIGDPRLSLPRTARRLGISERSLQRHLAEKNVSFHDLRERARRSLSDRLLAADDVPLYEVAERLGFSTTSTYTRTARRWYGAPPSEIRRRLLRGSD